MASARTGGGVLLRAGGALRVAAARAPATPAGAATATATAAAATTRAGLATAPPSASFALPDLPYDYDALAPAIDTEIMRLHHTKHHQTYVNNLNAAWEKLTTAVAAGDVAATNGLHAALRFNGGGHANHSLFWESLAPASRGGGGDPSGALAAAVDAQLGGGDGLRRAMTAATAGVQGSGWGWLSVAPDGRLVVSTSANQDPVGVGAPLLGIDIWEVRRGATDKVVGEGGGGSCWGGWTRVFALGGSGWGGCGGWLETWSACRCSHGGMGPEQRRPQQWPPAVDACGPGQATDHVRACPFFISVS